MNAEAILSVSAAVVALTQLIKWAGLPDKWGPMAVLGLALVGVVIWAFSTTPAYDRELIFPFFSGWISVALNAAGVFGFTRAAVSAVARVTPPPTDGAGSSRTTS
jgi:hypothetical protein